MIVYTFLLDIELGKKERVWALKDEGGVRRKAYIWEKSMGRSIEIGTRETGEAMWASSWQMARKLAQRT